MHLWSHIQEAEVGRSPWIQSQHEQHTHQVPDQPKLHGKISTKTKRWFWYYPSVSVLFNWLWACKGSTLHIHVQDLLQILIPSHVCNSKLSGNTKSRHRIPTPLINSSKKCALYLDTKHGLREDSTGKMRLYCIEEGFRIPNVEEGRTDLAPIESEDSEGLKNPQLHTHLSVALAH